MTEVNDIKGDQEFGIFSEMIKNDHEQVDYCNHNETR